MHVLFIHGMSCTGAVWNGWVDIFRSRGFTTHQPSLPFHDPADTSKVARLSEQDYIDWLAPVVAGLPERPVIVGHSNGGLLALKLTEMGLSRASLIMNAIGPRGTWAVYPRMLPHALPVFLRWGFWRKAVVLHRWQADHLIFNRLSRAEADEAFRGLVPESGLIATEAVFSPVLRSLSLSVLPDRITVPVRAMSALDDNLVAPGVGRSVKRLLGKSIELIEVPGRGHWMPWETGWERLAEESQIWLRNAAR